MVKAVMHYLVILCALNYSLDEMKIWLENSNSKQPCICAGVKIPVTKSWFEDELLL